jgi:hypothetical protein
VLSLVLVVLLVWFVASVLLAAWTLWFQGYIYTEPVGDLWWRAPTSGAAITLLLVFWVFCDYRAPGRYRELQAFSATEYREFKELHIINSDGKEEVFKLLKKLGGTEYILNGERGNRGMPQRPTKIIVVEGDNRYIFEPVQQRDVEGHYKLRGGESLRYRNAETGWEMTEGMPGQVAISRGGWLLGNLLLNLLHLAVWFVCLWLLLEYQWPHAFGLAVVFWLVTTLFVVPQVLDQVEKVARQRAPAAQSTP